MHNETFLKRFWVYQRERFPVVSYAVLVAALMLGTLGFVSAGSATGVGGWDRMLAVGLAGWLTALGVFFQLRVADEFKDYAVDVAYRPYRPVPRGVISRRELAWLAVGYGVVQLLVTSWVDVRAVLPLLGLWGYLLLMSREFFAHDWLVARPVLYMLSHMVIMALLFLFLLVIAMGAMQGGQSAGGGWLAGREWPGGWGWFVAAGYMNGIVFELGRKIRAPEDEETGVETYSSLWGPGQAALVWAVVVAGAGAMLILAAWATGAGQLMTVLPVVLWGAGLHLALRFRARPVGTHAKWLDRFSALWVLILYGAWASYL